MRANEFIVEAQDPRKTKYDVVRLQDADGDFTNTFVATADGEEIGRFEGKNKFDCGAAQEAAKKCNGQHKAAAINKQDAENEYKYQYEKPLSQLELEWVELDKKLVGFFTGGEEMTAAEQARYGSLGQIVRKSLYAVDKDKLHPAVKAHRGRV